MTPLLFLLLLGSINTSYAIHLCLWILNDDDIIFTGKLLTSLSGSYFDVSAPYNVLACITITHFKSFFNCRKKQNNTNRTQ